MERVVDRPLQTGVAEDSVKVSKDKSFSAEFSDGTEGPDVEEYITSAENSLGDK